MATASSSSSSSASCAAVPRWDYDVFLSFRGEDARAGFVSHLHSALRRGGVRVFIDDELRRGETISLSLERAIESSRIAIVIFSPNFAASTWCLQELTKILEMKDSIGQLVRPVFLRVDPSDVRKQTGVFAEIMARHEEVFVGDGGGVGSQKVKKWRDALHEAANLSGWHLGNGLESELIQKIVEEVSSKLHRPYLNVAKHPVALDKHIQAVRMSLHIEDDGVRVVGVCGISGIGKTTIAKAVYNMIADQFEGSSFLANIREISWQHGLDKLQESLLRDILGDKTIKVGYIQTGVELIRQKLCNKRILLVLDDVDSKDQLRGLMGERGWFGQGSRMILTTKDEEVLVAYGVEIYKVGELDYDDALQLFSWNAFQEPSPTRDYQLLSFGFTHYAKGLPLALIVLGSFLSGKNIREWDCTLERLRAVPDGQIDEILKISFDGLETNEQAIFLDIACFFKGEDKDYVTKLLDRCNFYPDRGLQILSQKSLIYMDSNKIWMHDLLQEMGREIVRQESPENPGRRSRLWYHEDILRVLRENSGTNSVEGIKLDMLEPEELFLGTKAIKKMKRLRLIMVRNIHISGCPEYLSNDLRWLDVHGKDLPAIVESYDAEQPSIHDSSPTEPTKNEQHRGPIRMILSRLTFKSAASRCKGALSDFKSIVANPLKLPQFLRFERCIGYSRDNGKADFDSDMLLKEYSVFKIFSKAELVRATNNFSIDNKIGIGGFGSVYQGILDDGRKVAIKWANVTGSGMATDVFIAEIKTLRHVNHKNLIRLLGFHARSSERAVVYEYLNNGSLYHHLHINGSSTLMSWNARIKVALDVARGIEYLHEFAGPRIVHRDVKSSNILLDENWTAKVTDFGLSVLLPEGEDEIDDFIAGTRGYLAPEYVSSGRLTAKSDVYGYGVVLLELLSGRKALDWDEDGSHCHIVNTVVPSILQDQMGQALDPNMPTPDPFEMKAVQYMAQLAVDCVQYEARNRPSMTDAVDRLRSASAQFSSVLCDDMKTSGSCKPRICSFMLCDDEEVKGSCNSSCNSSLNSGMMLEEEITGRITENQ